MILVQKGAPVQVLGFGDDGKTVYIYARVNRVSVWRVLVYYWPEAGGGLLALLTLWWIVRVARRPQVRGEGHCRCCNYLLKGLTSDRCPECGMYLTTRNRVAGRRRWPRVMGALVFLLIGTGAYFLAGAQLPRQGSVSAWFDWTSMSIAEWAEAGGRTWITRHATGDDVVLLLGAQVDENKHGTPEHRRYNTAMSSAKTTIRRIVKDLPENCTLEDVQYQLYLAQKVQRGLQSIREGRGIPHAHVKQRLSKWLSK